MEMIVVKSWAGYKPGEKIELKDKSVIEAALSAGVIKSAEQKGKETAEKKAK